MTEPAPATELQALLAGTLAIWGVHASVVAQGDVIFVRAVGGIEVRITRAPAGERPVRWSVRCEPGPVTDCTSIVAALSVLREALGVERGSALQISPVRSGE